MSIRHTRRGVIAKAIKQADTKATTAPARRAASPNITSCSRIIRSRSIPMNSGTIPCRPGLSSSHPQAIGRNNAHYAGDDGGQSNGQSSDSHVFSRPITVAHAQLQSRANAKNPPVSTPAPTGPTPAPQRSRRQLSGHHSLELKSVATRGSGVGSRNDSPKLPKRSESHK